MKEIVARETAVGGDESLLLGGAVGIEGQTLAIVLKASYPVGNILEPAFKVVDEMVDKIEKWIPGDQTEQAKKIKADARARMIELLSEKQVELPSPVTATPSAEAGSAVEPEPEISTSGV